MSVETTRPMAEDVRSFDLGTLQSCISAHSGSLSMVVSRLEALTNELAATKKELADIKDRIRKVC